jgi:hypothetical protein
MQSLSFIIFKFFDLVLFLHFHDYNPLSLGYSFLK